MLPVRVWAEVRIIWCGALPSGVRSLRRENPTEEARDDGMSNEPGAGARSGEAHLQAEDERLRQTELIISLVLRGGVLLAAAIIALGVVLFYLGTLRAGGYPSHLVYPKSAGAVFAGLAHGDPVSVIALGLLVLLLTPVLRVLVSVVTFAMEHDWRYTGITLLVFCILLVSFLLGRGGS